MVFFSKSRMKHYSEAIRVLTSTWYWYYYQSKSCNRQCNRWGGCRFFFTKVVTVVYIAEFIFPLCFRVFVFDLCNLFFKVTKGVVESVNSLRFFFEPRSRPELGSKGAEMYKVPIVIVNHRSEDWNLKNVINIDSKKTPKESHLLLRQSFLTSGTLGQTASGFLEADAVSISALNSNAHPQHSNTFPPRNFCCFSKGFSILIILRNDPNHSLV